MTAARNVFVMVAICVLGGVWSPKQCLALDLWEFLMGPRLQQLTTDGTMGVQQDLGVPEKLARSYGYRLDTHHVTAETGHIFTLHRLPKGRRLRKKYDNLSNSTRPVALLHHGILGSSDMWLYRGPKLSLAYLLADSGYDVWMVNMRGNVYSRKHTTLNPNKDPKYWQFGVEEIGLYDLAVTVDYIVNVTRQERLFFLGHSIGTSAALILCSLKPEYNNRFNLILALGPVANVRHVLSPLHKIVMPLASSLTHFLMSENIYEVFPRRPHFARMLEMLCHEHSPTHKLCLNTAFSFVGFDLAQLNTTTFVRLLQYYPAGTSAQLLLSTFQYYLTGNFARFDYGTTMLNVLHYNQTEPPVYNLSKVTTPVSLHYGRGDFLSAEKDIDDLASKLGNTAGKFPVPYKNFNHLDFLVATDVRILLYDKLLNLMDKYK